MTIALPAWAGIFIAVVVCGVALWKGEREERLAAAGLALSIVATFVLQDTSWPQVQRSEFVADSLLLVLLFAIALRTAKFWPLAAAGFQLLAVMTHIAKFIDRGVQQWAYLTAGVIWTYLLMTAITVGTWNTWRRRQAQKAATPAAARAARR